VGYESLFRIKALGFDRTCIYRWIAAEFKGICLSGRAVADSEARALEGRYSTLSEKMWSIFYGGMKPGEIAAFERVLKQTVDNLEKAELAR
jgi:hypothetical protein